MPWQFTTPGELEQVRAAGRLAFAILQQLRAQVRPGITTQSLADTAERLITDADAVPLSRGFQFDDAPPFPSVISVCVNDEVMFGVPSNRVIEPDDLVTIDLTLRTKLGWCADVATSIAVGGSDRATRLITAAENAISTVLSSARPGVWWVDVISQVTRAVGDLGLYVLPGPVGHGIGRRLHEQPHLYSPGHTGDVRLAPGMILAIEPVIVEEPTPTVEQGPWTVRTSTGAWAAFEERMIAITPHGNELLTR